MTDRDFKYGLSTETLSIQEAAAYLNISAETVRRLLQDGQLEGFRLSRAKVRIYKASLSRYVEEQQAVPVYDELAQSRLHARRQEAYRSKFSAPRDPAGGPASARGAQAGRRSSASDKSGAPAGRRTSTSVNSGAPAVSGRPAVPGKSGAAPRTSRTAASREPGSRHGGRP
jgi:excisionase family DNA binding protein